MGQYKKTYYHINIIKWQRIMNYHINDFVLKNIKVYQKSYRDIFIQYIGYETLDILKIIMGVNI